MRRSIRCWRTVILNRRKQFIEINESNPSADLVFRLQHPSGFEVKRTFHFEWADALISIDTQINAPNMTAENLQYSVVWGPGLGGQLEVKADFISFNGPTTFANNEREETRPEEMEKSIRHFSRGHPMDCVPEQIFRRGADSR